MSNSSSSNPFPSHRQTQRTASNSSPAHFLDAQLGYSICDSRYIMDYYSPSSSAHIVDNSKQLLRTRNKWAFLGRWFICSGSVTSVSSQLNVLGINLESPICVCITLRKFDQEGVQVWISHRSPCVFHLSLACDFRPICLFRAKGCSLCIWITQDVSHEVGMSTVL